jgi:flagellar biosynthesis protein FlhB
MNLYAKNTVKFHTDFILISIRSIARPGQQHSKSMRLDMSLTIAVRRFIVTDVLNEREVYMTDIKNTVEDAEDKVEHKAYEMKGEIKGRVKQMEADADQRSANEE